MEGKQRLDGTHHFISQDEAAGTVLFVAAEKQKEGNCKCCSNSPGLRPFRRCSSIGKRVASRMQGKKINILRVFLAQFVLFFATPKTGKIVVHRNGRKVGKSSRLQRLCNSGVIKCIVWSAIRECFSCLLQPRLEGHGWGACEGVCIFKAVLVLCGRPYMMV